MFDTQYNHIIVDNAMNKQTKIIKITMPINLR